MIRMTHITSNALLLILFIGPRSDGTKIFSDCEKSLVRKRGMRRYKSTDKWDKGITAD